MQSLNNKNLNSVLSVSEMCYLNYIIDDTHPSELMTDNERVVALETPITYVINIFNDNHHANSSYIVKIVEYQTNLSDSCDAQITECLQKSCDPDECDDPIDLYIYKGLREMTKRVKQRIKPRKGELKENEKIRLKYRLLAITPNYNFGAIDPDT